MRTLGRVSHFIGKACSYISAVFILFLMSLVTADVLLRKLFNSPINGGFEVSSLFMVILVFFAIVYTQSSGAAIHVTVIIMRFKGKARFVIWGIGMLVTSVMAAFFSYGSFVHGGLMRMVGTTSAVLRIPFWPFYYLGALVFFLYTITIVIDTIKAFAAIFNAEVAAEVSSRWVG